MDEKRELLHEISRWSDSAPEILQSWSRRELLQILCEEMGKERKYTGLTKSKIIEHLLKAVSENKSTKRKDVSDPESQAPATDHNQNTYKRQRKTDKPSRLPIAVMSDSSRDIDKSKYCQNLACRATLHSDAAFCKRCSCCICFQYDDNKDPSLWLVCSSEPPYVGSSCGMSCHLECAMKHERSGILKDEHTIGGLDGSFKCINCGKVNDLLSCIKKQLMTAKDTRRVDVLCYRISLSQKLLMGTTKYQKLHTIVEEAATKLEAEVGPISGLPVKMARGIVNRLSSGPEIQKLCSSAVETLDLLLSSTIRPNLPNPNPEKAQVRFENVKTTSLRVILGSDKILADGITGYTMWHRKANSVNYPPDPTCTLYVPNTRYLLSDLSPDTEYTVKVSSFSDAREVGTFEGTCKTAYISERDQSPTTNSSSLSNPSSEGDESNNITTYREPKPDNISGLSDKGLQDIPADSVSVLDEERGTWEDCSVHNANPIMGSPKPKNLHEPTQPVKPKGGGGPLFITPTKTGPSKDISGPSDEEKLTEIGSSTKKKSNARTDKECVRDEGTFEKEYTYCVKTIRGLECDGYIEKNFRLKFLTWYSLRATPEEKRIVKVFVDTFVDDPVSLAGQLVDTFSEDINDKKPKGIMGNGFCTRLFH